MHTAFFLSGQYCEYTAEITLGSAVICLLLKFSCVFKAQEQMAVGVKFSIFIILPCSPNFISRQVWFWFFFSEILNLLYSCLNFSQETEELKYSQKLSFNQLKVKYEVLLLKVFPPPQRQKACTGQLTDWAATSISSFNFLLEKKIIASLFHYIFPLSWYIIAMVNSRLVIS